jgi:hypothetical protein
MHGNILHFAIRKIDARMALGKSTKECNVPRQERNFATIERASDDLFGLT